MLKKFKTLTLIATTCLMFANTAQADVNEALQNICTIIKADDKGELRKKMRRVQADFRLNLKDYYTGVSCGGNSLLRTALLNNAIETATMMIKKMPKGDLEAPEEDGKTLLSWASDNGLNASPIVVALNDRI
jgi:hypothetical protein